MSDPGGCGRSDHYIRDDQYPYFREIYSLLLATHLSDQPVSLTLEGCLTGPTKDQTCPKYKIGLLRIERYPVNHMPDHNGAYLLP